MKPEGNEMKIVTRCLLILAVFATGCEKKQDVEVSELKKRILFLEAKTEGQQKAIKYSGKRGMRSAGDSIIILFY